MDYNNNQGGMEENVIQVKRVSKKNKGGNRISFTALVVVGNKLNTVGYSLGKAPTVVEAIQKAVARAKKDAIQVNIVNGTLPYDIKMKMGSAKIYAKPAPDGTGLIAGGAVRQVFEIAGIKNVSAKVLGTRNINQNVRAAYALLKTLKKVEPKEEIKKENDKSVEAKKIKYSKK